MEDPGKDVVVIETKPTALRLTKVAIETIKSNIVMAEELVMDALEKDVDYGRTPGTSQDGLWDPGAAKIMAAFNSYANHQILYHLDDDSCISWTMQANIISHDSQQVIATGVGAASTKETKYKYRWVFDPQTYGYSAEEIKTFKVKDGKYRIPNPEYGELVNTLLQMAAKRSECDAVKSLPGVGSALRKLFTPAAERRSPDWAGYHGELARMGVTEEEAHKMLGVASVNDWLKQGKTLKQALTVIVNTLAQNQKAPPAKAITPPPPAKAVTPTPPPATATRKAGDIKPSDIPNGFELEKIAFELWGLQPKDIWAELNYDSVKNFEDASVEAPWDCFLKLKAVRPEAPPSPEEQIFT